MKLIQQLLFIVLPLFFLLLPQKVFATELPESNNEEGVIFSDDFSSGYEKWQDVRNTFHLWSIFENQANLFINQGSTFAELVPTDAYWNPAWKNYRYKLDYTILKGADKGLTFWFKNTANRYQFHFIANRYILSHIKNGKEVWKQTGSLVLAGGQKQLIEVYAKDGTIKLSLNGIEKLSHFDPTFDNDHGKIGIQSAAGAVFPTHVRFDNISVSLIQDVIDFLLPISVFKQTDPAWASVEYDSASTWSENGSGIDKWGCLVSSITMVLHFHAITTLPNDEPLTPASLNAWLKQQSDGFIAHGLVNWSAISRLVRELHEKNNTTKLEYSRVAGSDLTTAVAKIKGNQPVILEIPGHFLVGNGVTQDTTDLFITDPAYSHQKLSQHDKQLSSTRLLTPSNTDLSYIYFTHSPNIRLTLTDLNHAPLQNHDSYTHFLQNSTHTDTSPEVVVHEVAKPETTSYLLSVYNSDETADPQPFSITILSYDALANPTQHTYSGTTSQNNNPTYRVLEYYKEQPSVLVEYTPEPGGEDTDPTPYNNFEALLTLLLADIDELTENNDISRKYVALELEKLILAAQSADQENKLRYTIALEQTITWYDEYISQHAHQVLLERLEHMKTQ